MDTNAVRNTPEAVQPNVGDGPYTIGQDSAGMWRVYLVDEPVSGSLVAAKTAARKAREMNAAYQPAGEPGDPAETMALGMFGDTPPNAEAIADLEPAMGPAATSAVRHDWLERAADWSKGWLAAHGTDVPDKVRVSIGTMYASKVAIGQCWHEEASEDGYREVFVSPTVADSATIMGVLVHELIHAALATGTKHGPVFKQAAIKAGLAGKMTATHAGPELAEAIEAFLREAGPYPAARLNPAASGIKRQGTRLLKCECAVCGYTVRTTAKWLNLSGAPFCPTEWEPPEDDEDATLPPHGRMSVEEVEEGE